MTKSSAPSNKELAEKADNIHAEVYSVWNGSADRLNVLELNHLQSALRGLSELRESLESSAPELEELRKRVEAEYKRLNDWGGIVGNAKEAGQSMKSLKWVLEQIDEVRKNE